jgi:hypothetical protein
MSLIRGDRPQDDAFSVDAEIDVAACSHHPPVQQRSTEALTRELQVCQILVVIMVKEAHKELATPRMMQHPA